MGTIETIVEKIKQSITNTYAMLYAMGADAPENETSDNLATTAGTVKVVKYDEQTLSEEQKAQARENIGAEGIHEVPNSATVNADNELVMQRTDGDAVAELFKVALPASGGGGSEWEVVQDVTLTEDVAEVSLGNGVAYKDMVMIVSPMKINNAAGDGASGATTSPKIYTGGTYAFIDKMPINSNSIIVITSLSHGGARVNNLYKHSPNAYYNLTNTNASSYFMPTQFTAGATTVSWARITMSGEWLLKSGVRVTLYGRK